MLPMIFMILVFLVGAAALYYVHRSKESFDDPVPQDDPIQDLARPQEHYDITAQPINDRLYFIEVKQDVIQSALTAAIKNQLSQPWETLKPVTKFPSEAQIETVILRALNEKIPTWEPVQKLQIPFALKKLNLVECRSIDAKTPFYYSRWTFIIHRDTKLLGFYTTATFLHYNAKTYLCEFEIVGEVFEDKVEMIVSNVNEYSSFAPAI